MSEIELQDIFQIDCDLIIIPISTVGSLSGPFAKYLNEHEVPQSAYRKSYQLGEVEIVPFETPHFRYIAFACAVEDFTSNYTAIRQIGRTVAQQITQLEDVKLIASVILGTGAGSLGYVESLSIMRNAFYEAALLPGTIVFCTPDQRVYNSILKEPVDRNILSAVLVLRADSKRLLANKHIEPIAYADEFYYELARKKFLEFWQYDRAPDFFSELLAQFKSEKSTFSRFLEYLDSRNDDDRRHFWVLCGELIAYIDYNAYNKSEWNQYHDRRVIAKSNVNQTHWVTNLLKAKISGSYQTGLPKNIKNALAFLAEPLGNISVLSVKHRELIYSNLRIGKYEGEASLVKLFYFFRDAGFRAINPENEGALLSRILYYPEVKKMWLTDDLDEGVDLIIDDDTEDLSHARYLVTECMRSKNKRLDLGRCGLTDLDSLPELFECIHLEELILSNEWAIYQDQKWRKQVSNNKGKRNLLQSLSTDLKALKNLKRLICGGDWKKEDGSWDRWGIKNIKPVADLKKLVYVNLSNNTINDPAPLSRLTKLEFIHLNNNVISRQLPMARLVNLKELNLSSNILQDIGFLADAPSLLTLDLHANRIADISPLEDLIRRIGIKNAKWELGTINIAKNPMERPPMEIVIQGKDAVLSVLADIRKEKEYINTQIKIILIGNSEAGKTTLAKYLSNDEELHLSHPATHWMREIPAQSKAIVESIGRPCELRLFDFGGHDYYHDTHQVFFTANTIYLLLWETATNNLKSRPSIQIAADGTTSKLENQDYPVEYWLDSVKFYNQAVEADNFAFKTAGNNAYEIWLLLLQNKVGNRALLGPLNNERLIKDYAFIFDLLNLSIIKPSRNMGYFDHVFKEMLDHMSILGAVLPGYFGVVKDAVTSYTGPAVLSPLEFQAFCNSRLKNPIDLLKSNILARYLDQIGILLCSKNLEGGRIYIRKEVIIDEVYKVLTELAGSKGEISLKEFADLFPENGVLADAVLAFMQEFKMIFKHPIRDIYIAPLYLPAIPATSVNLFLDKRKTPYRRFTYCGFIHKQVILAFFAQYGQFIKEDPEGQNYYYWKDALIIKDTATEEIVMIKFDIGKKKGDACIDVYNFGHGTATNFIKKVIEQLRLINKGYDTEEMVSLDGKIFVSVELLNQNAEKGLLVFTESKLSDKEKPVAGPEHIFRLKDYQEFLTNQIKKKRVVISYSKKDLAQVHELRRYLQPLVDDELIGEPWYCTRLLAADQWETVLKPEFEKADIVFFMISADFYATPYIIKNEVQSIFDRYDRDKNVKIVPIFLEFYDWARKGTYDFSRFAGLPYKAKPVSDFKNPKLAWYTIALSVKEMILQDLDPENQVAMNRELQLIYERLVEGKLDDSV
ncbi:leucine-rich repeat domain-containing protein [Mucilaginibacter sp.]|uniref:leucine-rich repeat domain-containing protein n=1 Tax=Mucilaginibacter sp. TaxID=1882438 RepID=UPI00260F7279|nr:leucine-rich repeat domain-containing protein [Mucilaginibacter sp.]MDB4922921.1 Miro domain protein [Mucilaginibacter sp.]